MSPKIYLVFPCYNPEPQQWKNFENYIQNLKAKANAEIQITVIDDGSPQFVPPPLSLSSKIKLIQNKTNQGKGGILKQSVALMGDEHDIFAFLDFDVPYSVDDLLGICASVWAGVDICIGDRTGVALSAVMKSSQERHVSDRISRGFAHKIFRSFFAVLITGGIHDTQCGIKAYDAKIIRAIVKKSVLTGFLFDVEWLYIGMKHKLAVRTWPVFLDEHHTSSSLRSFFKLKFVGEVFVLLKRILLKNYLSDEVLNTLQARRNLQKQQLTRD